jgi:hypothetical protein
MYRSGPDAYRAGAGRRISLYGSDVIRFERGDWVEIPIQEGAAVDRRWYPAGNPVEWASTTRQVVFVSARRCIAHAIAVGLRADAPAEELYASDAMFRELHICVDAYARGLFALGQTEEGTIGLIVAAAREAAEPAEIHLAVLVAIERWCRDARVPT